MVGRKKEEVGGEINIQRIEMASTRLCILGRTPFIFNSMSAKAQTDLLIGSRKKTTSEKQANIKHDPVAEYRDSVYRFIGEQHPTRLYFPSGAFKKVMATTALEIPGAAKSQINRLIWITPRNIAMYGVPELFISVVRSADMQKTPDMRTRAILPRWAATFTVNYSKVLNTTTVANLLASGGQIVGVGDWRQEKGSGDYGQFDVVSPTDEEFLEVMKNGGRVAQDRALLTPKPHRGEFGENDETERLLEAIFAESKRREKTVTLPGDPIVVRPNPFEETPMSSVVIPTTKSRRKVAA